MEKNTRDILFNSGCSHKTTPLNRGIELKIDEIEKSNAELETLIAHYKEAPQASHPLVETLGLVSMLEKLF